MIIKGAKHSLAAKTVASKKPVKKVEEPAAAPVIEEEILSLEEEDLDLKPNRYKNVKILPLEEEDEDFSFNVDID